MAFGVGSSVGYVYVEVLADTSSMREQILRDAKKDGSDGGEVFGNNFARSVEDSAQQVQFDKIYKKSIDNLSKDIATQIREAEKRGLTEIEFSIRDDWADELKGIARQYGITFKELEERIEKDLTAAVRKASDEVEREEANNLKTRLDNLKKVAQEQERQRKAEARERSRLERLSFEAYAAYLTKKERAREAANKAAVAAAERLERESYEAYAKYLTQIERDKQRQLARDIADQKRLSRERRRIWQQDQNFFAGDDVNAAFDRVAKKIRSQVSVSTRQGFVDGTRQVDFGPEINRKLAFVAKRFGVSLDEVLAGVGKRVKIDLQVDRQRIIETETALGRTSARLDNLRRGALNFRGQFAYGVTAPLRLAISAASGVFKAFSNLSSQFTKLGDFFNNLAGQGGKLAGIFSKLGGGAAALGSRFAALAANPITAVIAALVALVAGLFIVQFALAAVSIVVQTFAAALLLVANTIGAVVASAAVLGPVLLGIGAAGIAGAIGVRDVASAVQAYAKYISSGLPEDQEKFNEALEDLAPNAQAAVLATKPLIETFKGLREQLQQDIFANLAPSIERLQPLFQQLRDGLAGFGPVLNTIFQDVLNTLGDPRFSELLTPLISNLQIIAGDVGSAATSFFSGLLAVFSAISPIATQFSDSLATGAENFETFAKSPEGQTQIQDFFQTAYDLASQVWDIISELIGLFGDLFGQTNDETATGLQTILDKIREWRDWVNNNEDTINLWLTRAADFARDVWGAIETVISVMSKIDTSLVGSTIGAIASAFAAVVTQINIAYAVAKTFVNYVRSIPSKIGSIVSNAVKSLAGIPFRRSLPSLPEEGDEEFTTQVGRRTQRTVNITQYNTFPQTDGSAAAASVLNRIVTANI